MEEEIQKIKQEKDLKMNEILGHGDKFTVIMDGDWFKNWNANKDLKTL